MAPDVSAHTESSWLTELYHMEDNHDDDIFGYRPSILDDEEEATVQVPPASYSTEGTLVALDELYKVGLLLKQRGLQYRDSYLIGGRFGVTAREKLLARLDEKINRLESCILTGADEKDTLQDIVGYSVLLLAEKRYREEKK